MAKNYMQDGNTVRFTAAAAVKSGDVVKTLRRLLLPTWKNPPLVLV